MVHVLGFGLSNVVLILEVELLERNDAVGFYVVFSPCNVHRLRVSL